MLPLATGKEYPSISKKGQQNPGIALEDFNSVYFRCDFQIPRVKICQNTNFQLTSSCESIDIPIKDIKGTLSGLRQFFVTERPLKMMKIAFYFTLKALFVLKIFKFLSSLFDHV